MALVGGIDLAKVVSKATSNVGNVANKTASALGGGSTSVASTPRAGDNAVKPFTYKINGTTYTVNPASNGGYMQAYDQYVKDAEARKALYNKQFDTNVNNLKNTLSQNNTQTNSNYDNAARQAYVQYMQRQRALPSQLQALGVNGGATESGLLNLYNNYGNVHASNEQQRNAELATNQQAYDDAYANMVSNRTNYLMDYEADLAAQKQTALNNQMNEYNNEITRFSSSVAQYPTTEKGYQQYKDWIERMKNSNDPLKSMKIALIRQQMATQFPDGAPKEKSSGGGGGGGSRRRSGGGRSRGSSSSSSSNSSGSGYSGNTRAAYEARFKSSGSSRSTKSSNNKNKWQKYGIHTTGRWVG